MLQGSGMDMLVHIIAALATYRIARMVTRENGPFGMFFHLRALATSRILGTRDDPLPSARRWGWIAEGVSCPACASFWIGLAIALLLHAPWWYGLAYSGAATWLASVEK